MYEFIMANQAFVLGMIATLIVWVIYRVTGKSIDKAQIMAILTTILDIIQNIKTGPETKDLSDAEKKALAVKQVEAVLPAKKVTLVKKVFGTVGGAVEYVYHNRKWLWGAATVLLKKVF